MENAKVEYEPRFFSKYDNPNPLDVEKDCIEFRTKNNYWLERKQNNWEGMPDLFGPDTPDGSDVEN